MALEEYVRLAAIEIAARLQFVLVGISANVAPEAPQKFRFLLEAFQFSGNERYKFLVNVETHGAYFP